MHGYQIATTIGERGDGYFHFKHGTLYPILHRLEEDGLIQGTWSKEGGRRRKVYSLTHRGERRVVGGTDRVQDVVSRLLAMLRAPGEATA